MKKYEVLLNFFGGFYESIHGSVFDEEEKYIMEDYPKHNEEDFRFTCDRIEYCKNYVSAISSKLGINFKFMELTSPKEYNFTTDKLSVWMTSKDLKKISSVLSSDTLKNLIKRRFTSRDGFSSWYSNEIEEWKENKITDWNCVELGTLLDAWIIENETQEYYDNLDYVGYEYCQGNGRYVDYEKLWDEEAEKQEKELYEDELKKLEVWKSNVADWEK